MRLQGPTCGGGAFPFASRFLAACLGAFLLWGLACAEKIPPRRNNVLLIVVDTQRRDHLGIYGHILDTSPSIDAALAVEGTLFAHAYTTAPWTQPAVASLFTGRYPSTHGLTNIYQKLHPKEVTLAEYFASHGYATEGIVSHRLVGRRFNFDQGFERYSDEAGMEHNAITTEKVTDKAIAALGSFASQERPFFLFVHYFDPHFSYHDHPTIDFAREASGRFRKGLPPMNALRSLEPPPRGAEKAFILARYDEEVRHTDAGIGRLLAALVELGLDDDTVIALTSDHGEAVFEHGWLGHTIQLYEEVLAVPLIVRPIRSEAAPRTVDARVSTLALTPTLLELAGLAPEVDAFQAASLAPWIRGEAGTQGPIFAEVDYRPANLKTANKRARKQVWIHGRHKLIWDDIEGKAELYDLAGDPGEKRDLAARQPRRTEGMLAAMRTYHESLETSAESIESVEPSQEELEALRALGYLGDAEEAESAPVDEDESGGES